MNRQTAPYRRTDGSFDFRHADEMKKAIAPAVLSQELQDKGILAPGTGLTEADGVKKVSLAEALAKPARP